MTIDDSQLVDSIIAIWTIGFEDINPKRLDQLKKMMVTDKDGIYLHDCTCRVIPLSFICPDFNTRCPDFENIEAVFILIFVLIKTIIL